MIQVIALNEQGGGDVERPVQVSVTLPRVQIDTPYFKVFAHAEHWHRIGRLVSQSILNTDTDTHRNTQTKTHTHKHSPVPPPLVLSLFPPFVFHGFFCGCVIS
jgi:hypothetical protein